MNMGKSVLLALGFLIAGGAQTAFSGGAAAEESAQPTAAAAAPTSEIVMVADRYTWPENWLATPTASELGIIQFHEAPMLAAMVSAGTLPPVEERLPDDPLVIAPYAESGEYGGTLRVARTGPGDWGDMYRGHLFSMMFRMDPSLNAALPLVAQRLELSGDGRQITIHLRPGAKWSDGMPFTTADIMWQYEHVLADLDFEWKREYWRGRWTLGGSLAKFSAPDDYTLYISFDKPISRNALIYQINFNRVKQGVFFTPAHVSSRYHAATNPDAAALAKEEGFETWHQALGEHLDMAPGQPYAQPEMSAWPMKSRDSSGIYMERNPYFFAVDTAGNQLPYIDKLEAFFYSDAQVALLDMMQGKLDIGGRLMNPVDFALYKDNESAGSYTIREWQDTKTSRVMYYFNLNHPDPVKSPVLRDKRFRQALSLAINREEINEFVFQGLAIPQQFTVHPGAPFYDPAWARSYADFDPERAQQVLDEMGMTDRDGDGWREAPGGEPFSLDMLVPTHSVLGAVGFSVSEVVREYWIDVGIKINYRHVSDELNGELWAANKLDLVVTAAEQYLHTQVHPLPNFEEALGYALNWNDWIDHRRWVAGGREGPEPPKGEAPDPEWLQYVEAREAWAAATAEDELNRTGSEVWAMTAELLPSIGTVGAAVRPILISNRVHNVPATLPFAFEALLWMQATPVQWFIRE